MQIGKLISVQFYGQLQHRGGLEHTRNLLRRESDAFAETVDRINQPVAREFGQHMFGDFGDKGVLVAVCFRGQRMRAEKGADDSDVPLLCKLRRGPQRFALIRQIEPVAGLDLDRGRALRDQRVEPFQRGFDELILACGAQRLDG